MPLTATLTITPIGTQVVGVPFTVSGTYQLNQTTWTGQIVYEDNGGAPIVAAAPVVTLGTSSWSFTHTTLLPVGDHTVRVKNR